MKFQKVEYHQVNLIYTYDYDDEDIVAEFGSVERFSELLSQLGDENFYPEGEPATEEEADKFYEFCYELDSIEAEEDWWTARKGGYEVSWRSLDD